MLSFADTRFRYDPYPIGLAKNVLDEPHYNELIRKFPSEHNFVKMGGGYSKFSLSEVNNPTGYQEFLMTSPAWQEFYRYIKDSQFFHDVFVVLQGHGIKIGLTGRYKSRFEFSSLPASGGFLKPHRDIPSKVVTLIIPMMARGEWKPEWGGGTDVLKPKNLNVELIDYKTPIEEFDIVESLYCDFNNCVLFIKTDNSWHSVNCSGGPVKTMRRTVTINIERTA